MKDSENYKDSDVFRALRKHLLDDFPKGTSVPKDVPPDSIERLRDLLNQLNNLSKPTGKDQGKAAALIELCAQSMMATALEEPTGLREAEVSKANLSSWERVCHSTSRIFGNNSERAIILLGMYKILEYIAEERHKQASKEPCFIATAACGSEDALDVVRLREFRDIFLRRSSIGRFLIYLYGCISPPLARSIAHSACARAIVRNLVVIPARWLADRVLDGQKE